MTQPVSKETIERFFPDMVDELYEEEGTPSLQVK